jgi:hypothetical protein
MQERREITCSKCGHKMVFIRRITPPSEDLNIAGMLYRCPTRKGEGGCGAGKEEIVIL